MTPEELQQKILKAEAQIAEESKRIEFYITEYSVELLANKMRDGEFEIPPYQRDDTWEPQRKWRFIESVLMGLPIPFLFFWESPITGKLEVVDGSQRLRSIHQFIHGGMEIGELEQLTELAGLTFADLPRARQRKITNRSIRGIVLNEHADEEARFDLFDRINTGSKVANKAEVRRGAIPGPFLDLVIELSANSFFEALAPVSDTQNKLREREELVTRFFAYGDGLDGYRDRVSEFLFAYARKMTAQMEEQPQKVAEYRDRFLNTMQFVKRTFPYGFRSAKKGTVTRRARFEAIAIGSYQALTIRPTLHKSTVDVGPLLKSEDFSKLISSDGANAIARLRNRIGYVRDYLVGKKDV